MKKTKFTKTIEKQIHDDIQYYLDEIDFEKFFDPEEVKKRVKWEIDSIIKSEVSKKIEASMFKQLNKEFPIIDAWVNDKVRAILMEINKI